MADVLVNVSATAGKGRTTIAAIIVDALERAGIKVEIGETVEKPVNAIRSAASLVENGTVVQINEIQVQRGFSLG